MLWVNSHVGLGDQVYMRPFVNWFSQFQPTAVSTSWPELYWDNPKVMLIRDHKNLRTQHDNIDRVELRHKKGDKDIWAPVPQGAEVQVIKLSYTTDLVSKKRNVFEALATSAAAGINTANLFVLEHLGFALQLPPDTDYWNPSPIIDGKRKPLALLRLPTRRKEWDCPARNPEAKVWGPIIERLKETHHVHGIAFLKDHEEWLDGCPAYYCDTVTLNGELRWTEMAAMMQIADICVCSPSNWIPLGLAVGAKLFCVFGGHVSPNALVHKAMIQYPNQWEYVAPEPFCFCVNNRHTCNKNIPQSRLLPVLENALSSSAARSQQAIASLPQS